MVKLSPHIIIQIDKLRKELESEMGYPYTREDIIEKAITALNDVRGG